MRDWGPDEIRIGGFELVVTRALSSMWLCRWKRRPYYDENSIDPRPISGLLSLPEQSPSLPATPDAPAQTTTTRHESPRADEEGDIIVDEQVERTSAGLVLDCGASGRGWEGAQGWLASDSRIRSAISLLVAGQAARPRHPAILPG